MTEEEILDMVHSKPKKKKKKDKVETEYKIELTHSSHSSRSSQRYIDSYRHHHEMHYEHQYGM